MSTQNGVPKVSGLLSGYTGLWPREVLEAPDLFDEVKEKLGKSGVYVLYRDDVPYYIGQGGRLYRRLRSHARKSTGRRYYFWNFFAAFVVPEEHIDEAEAMLIAAMPTANSARPKISPIKLSVKARNRLKEIRLRRAGFPEKQLAPALEADEDAEDDDNDEN
jgi:predicted GIY-YIG superfamily endonuclease